MENKINKTLLKSFENTTDESLLVMAKCYKIENRVNSSRNFQINYDTILYELKERGLLK